jgi:hypothetical protein
MKQDRFLTGILIGIGVLIVAALVVFFTRQSQPTYSGQNTPDGVVHDYVLAILNKDYPKAYGYLADLDHKPTLAQFRQAFAVGKMTPGDGGIRIGQSSVTGDDATVEVSMVYSAGDPFSSGYTNVGTAQLVRQNGAWKISSMPTYNIWDFSWYQPGPK